MTISNRPEPSADGSRSRGVPNPGPLTVAFATALLAAGFGAGLAAQSPREPTTWEILGRVRSESGRPIEGARVSFLSDPIHGLSWLAAIDPPPAAIEGRSDGDGRFNLRTPSPTGALLVEHTDGLGAVVERVAAQAPVPVVIRPLAELRRADGAPLRAWLRALPRNGVGVPIGRREGQALRLPAGRWLLLVEDGDRRVELRVELLSGRSQTLTVPRRDPEVADAPSPGIGMTAHAARWLEAGDLLAAGSMPAMAAPVAWIGRVRQAEGTHLFRAWSNQPRLPAVTSLPAWRALTVTDADGAPLAGARVLGVIEPAGGASVVSESASDARGVAAVALPDDRTTPTWIVVIRASSAPRALLWTEPGREPPPTIALTAGASRRVRVQDGDGRGIADARVELRAPGPAFMDRVFRTDAQGFAVLTDVPAGVLRLRVDSGRHVPCATEVPAAAITAPIPLIALDDGVAIHGRVILGPDAPAADVDIELRDPSGNSAMRPRFAVTDREGRFRFEGLADGTYTLFATAAPDGITWSGQRIGAQPGDDEWTLLLTSEDPQPGTRR